MSAFIIGLFAHLFGIVNVIKNYDNAYFYRGYGYGITSGRWFLSVMGKIVEKFWGGDWNLQFYNGIITLILMAIAAYAIVRLFDIRDLRFCAVWAGIFIAFPSVTAMNFYVYTAPHYAISILMVIAAVYLTVHFKFGFLPGAILGACAVGVYQAHFPIMIGLFVTVLIDKAMEGSDDFKELFKKGILYFATLILSLVLYFVVLKGLIYVFDIQLNAYQGIDKMGEFNLSELPEMLVYLYTSFFSIVKEDYMGISATGFTRTMILLLGVMSAFMIGYIIVKKREEILKKNKGLLILLLVIYPIAVNTIVLMCYRSYKHTLMIHAMVLIFLLPFLVYRHFAALDTSEKGGKMFTRMKMGILVAFAMLILNYCYQSNAAYTALYFKNRQAENYWTSVITQVKMQENFTTDLKWAFVGQVHDELYWNPWDQDYYIGGNTNNILNAYSTDRFISQYLGYYIELADVEEQKRLSETEEVKNMPVYPNNGSIQILGDTIVIKFSDDIQ